MKRPPANPNEPPWQISGDKLRLAVRVQPGASRTRLGETIDGRLRVYVSAPPTDGQANTQLIELIAKQFGITKSSIQLLRGAQSRNKDLQIDDTSCLPKDFPDNP